MAIFVEQARLWPRARVLLRRFVVAIAIAGAATGCHRGKKPPEAAHAPAAADLTPLRAPPPPARALPEPLAVPLPERHGGSLRVHLDAEPATLLPTAESDAAGAEVALGLIYETLLDCRDGSYRPGLAESWTVSDDGMRLVVRLRNGVRWHDHRAFTVLDVQATVEPLLRTSGEPSVLRAELGDVSAVELVTERTVRFVLKRPSDFALRALCDVPMLPEHAMPGGRPESSPLGRQPIGTGPYRFAGWERGKRIRLERAPEYWGPPGGVDDIVFDFDPDAVKTLNRTRRGDIDLLTRVLDVHYPDQVEPATLHGATELLKLPSRRYSFLALNHRHYPLSDVRFRRAVSALWDRQRFAGELHNDLARPIGGPPLVDDPPPPAFDRRQAVAALDDAGYRDSDADGVRDHLGQPLRFTLLAPAGNRLFGVEARAFVLEMRRAGLLVDMVPADAAVIQQRLKAGEFDFAPMIWQGAPDEDPSLLFGSAGAFNASGYRSTTLDALIDEARVAHGAAARVPVLARIEHLLADEQPVIFLYRYDVPALASTRLHGLAAIGDRFDLRRAWLSP